MQRIASQHLPYVRQRLQETGLWFVDIPRTSTTAIKQALAQNFGKLYGKRGVRQGVQRGLVPDHTPAALMREQLGSGLWDGLRTFSIVRNPWDRILSLYLYRTRIEGDTDVPFEEYVERLHAHRTAADDDSPDPLFRYHGHHYGCADFLLDEDGQLAVARVVRFEQRDQELADLAREWNLRVLAHGQARIGATGHHHYSAYYDAERRRLLEEAYADDVERWAYRFETD